MNKKKFFTAIISICISMLMLSTVFAAEKKEGTFGTLPPLSVIELTESNASMLTQPKATTGEWIQDSSSGKWWYRHTDGSYTTNAWEQIGDRWYHFDSSGWMLYDDLLGTGKRKLVLYGCSWCYGLQGLADH